MARPVRIVVAGEGGQGVQSIAEILASAAYGLGKEALYIPNFGVEQRGGVSIAFVQISESHIGAPKFQIADILIPLSPRSVVRTKQYAGNETVYIYDNSLITPGEVNDHIVGQQYFNTVPPSPTDTVQEAKSEPKVPGETKSIANTKNGPGVNPQDIPPNVKQVIAIPANDIATNELHPRVFNIIILGAVIGVTEILPLDTIKEALERKLGDKFQANPKLRELNYAALQKGYELVKKAI
jgi:2-oxoglutarate ferredoxin oxidoreductase subunit gamma